ncbi:caspase family protein [Xanthobacter flavus]|uniref:caspase family protein n=1 Tax=Xanthobacter flavus TaxID=281 RepID=UPI00372B7832
MTSIAILIGNAAYTLEHDLPCCIEDVAAMKSLLEATERFEKVYEYVDLEANTMRARVRDALPTDATFDDILFYFSGHGAAVGTDLYFCGTTFDLSRPNETGFRYSELLDLFRVAKPGTLISIIDACFAGIPLIKSDKPPFQITKDGLKNFVQFSSSLYSQTSIAGEKLSDFTRNFIDASLRKTSGTIYYTDISNIIRDNFMSNDEQTPFFITQGTGREILVDDANKLSHFREEFQSIFAPASASLPSPAIQVAPLDVNRPAEQPTIKDLLIAAEERVGDRAQVDHLVAQIFDGIIEAFNESEFCDWFELKAIEHSTFQEDTSRDFIVRVLSREPRPDRLVVAEIERKKRRQSLLEQATYGLLSAVDPEWTERFTLSLNCKMSRAQMKITMTPLYKSLQQIQLIVTCAPSLNKCYIFEFLTQHPMTDWDSFDPEGREISRRWFNLDWDGDANDIIAKISEGLTKAVRDHIDEITKRLGNG